MAIGSCIVNFHWILRDDMQYFLQHILFSCSWQSCRARLGLMWVLNTGFVWPVHFLKSNFLIGEWCDCAVLYMVLEMLLPWKLMITSGRSGTLRSYILPMTCLNFFFDSVRILTRRILSFYLVSVKSRVAKRINELNRKQIGQTLLIRIRFIY